MSNLFFGGSSDIALKIAKNLKSTDAVSSKKVDNSYRKVFEVKNYNYSNLNKLEGEFT